MFLKMESLGIKKTVRWANSVKDAVEFDHHYVCTHCSSNFQKMMEFIEHILSDHFCHHCNLFFQQEKNRSLHTHLLHRIKPWCSLCYETKFATELSLTKHILTKHSGKDIAHKYYCSLCTYETINRPGSMEKHIKDHLKAIAKERVNEDPSLRDEKLNFSVGVFPTENPSTESMIPILAFWIAHNGRSETIWVKQYDEPPIETASLTPESTKHRRKVLPFPTTGFDENVASMIRSEIRKSFEKFVITKKEAVVESNKTEDYRSHAGLEATLKEKDVWNIEEIRAYKSDLDKKKDTPAHEYYAERNLFEGYENLSPHGASSAGGSVSRRDSELLLYPGRPNSDVQLRRTHLQDGITSLVCRTESTIPTPVLRATPETYPVEEMDESSSSHANTRWLQSKDFTEHGVTNKIVQFKQNEQDDRTATKKSSRISVLASKANETQIHTCLHKTRDNDDPRAMSSQQSQPQRPWCARKRTIAAEMRQEGKPWVPLTRSAHALKLEEYEEQLAKQLQGLTVEQIYKLEVKRERRRTQEQATIAQMMREADDFWDEIANPTGGCQCYGCSALL